MALCTLVWLQDRMDGTMKTALTLLAVLGLSACMGPEGNPDGQPYADQGMIGVKPQPAPAVAYDPNTAQPAYDSALYGTPAATPMPPPVNQPLTSPPRR